MLLHQAQKSYPLDFQNALTHANILTSCNRPRAALRRLEGALDYGLQRRDLTGNVVEQIQSIGWNLRLQAGRCACLCAEQQLQRNQRGWIREHLPVALERLAICADAAPGAANGPLGAMMQRGQELLDEARSEVAG